MEERKEATPDPLWPRAGEPLGLVSSSPRRAALLRQAGVSFVVIPPSHGDETPSGAPPEREAVRLAREKALAARPEGGPRFLLAADTLVAGEGGCFGKPADPKEAARMLLALSGRWHRVVTGVCIVDRARGVDETGVEETRVLFRELGPEEVAAYVSTGEPFDKAGAYGIQGRGALLVERIDGCYANVVGLPLVRTRAVFRTLLGMGRTGGGERE
ncbi:MAG: septum formation protein Maf [Candidatus Eisenbacteria bacterium]|nr:septum formation protein Maf [Candidatus Eisenbacteria bacterium]